VASSEVPDTAVAALPATNDEPATPATTVPVASTPGSNVGFARFIVAGVGVLAIAAALGSLEITKRTRKVPSGMAALEQAHGV